MCIVASFPFAKMMHWGIILAPVLAKGHYNSAPRPQRSCFAHPNVQLALGYRIILQLTNILFFEELQPAYLTLFYRFFILHVC